MSSTQASSSTSPVSVRGGRLLLVHLSGSHQGTVQEFERESVLIGRADSNDVQLDPFVDTTVSAQHAEIRIERGTAYLYDMGSLNGTFLNGQAVRRARLSEGDEVGLGREGPRLRFALDLAAGPGPAATRPQIHPVAQPRIPVTSIEPASVLYDESRRRSLATWIIGGALLLILVWLATLAF